MSLKPGHAQGYRLADLPKVERTVAAQCGQTTRMGGVRGRQGRTGEPAWVAVADPDDVGHPWMLH